MLRRIPLAALAALAAATALSAQGTVPIGASVDATFRDRRWQVRRLSEFGDVPATVLFFATVECPLVQRYLPRIGEFAAAWQRHGVRTVVVYEGAGDDLVDAAGQCVLAAPAAEFGQDFDGSLAEACGVDRTAAAVVLDRGGRIAYRGRVDDQYGYGGARETPSRRDLAAAVEDLLAERPVAVATTEISGCKLTPAAAPVATRTPTWARDVAPILQRHCQECHRPDGQAPFSLLEPNQAQKRAAMIAEVVTEGRMPLWYGSTRHGEFANVRRVPHADRETIAAWADAGAPVGELAERPAPRQWPEAKWRIGEPDLEIRVLSAIRLPADGVVPYKYFLLPYRFEADTWVEAFEIRPENKRVLHHCNLVRVRVDERFSQDGFITGYVPGGDPMVLDPGTAVRIPKGSALVLQAHYVTTGTPEVDHLGVGLRFPRVAVQKELKVTIVSDRRFEIPPGAPAHPVRAARTLKHDVDAIGLFVHMHLRGRDITVAATAPDSKEETLLVVPNYNFDWQQSYRWDVSGRPFAAGTRIRALAHYDNSAWNPFNPDPTAPVRFGEETTDEMMYAFLFWTRRGEALGLVIDPANGHAVAAGR
ncbi:MAG: alkyl hydroperoxide reductase [Planctomycetes bacterium]|nr:alkyl hydroperoxide reductase [Planctomycetota bacterium]